MRLPIDSNSIRLFLRLLLGLILLSVAVSKLIHPGKFRKDIEDYKIIPHALNSTFAISTIFSYCLPLMELAAGVGLISGFLLTPTVVLASTLFVAFSGAITFNLIQGRTDLSCHCGGALGEHRISWWLVGRNALFVFCSLTLILTPPDPFTIDTLVRRSSTVSIASWMSIALPVLLLVVGVLVVFVLLNTARTVLRP